jgi:GTP pyrophosphokinase
MVRNNVEFEQIYDLIAFRILVDNVGQCYQALGYVHAMWRPISERFKDYIAVPKSNGYQSLHTTVIGPGGDLIEVQIRTKDMHRVAESGIAAHWRYKEGRLALTRDDIEKISQLRQLYELAQDVKDPAEFMQSIRSDLFSDEIYVFTPRGDLREFPEGATPLDFAFAVHTEVGLRCAGAKVNGRIVPFSYQLRNGDSVEILTASSARPSADWMNLVATARARNKIRNFLRQEERERGRELGKEIVEKEFKRFNLNLNKMVRDNDFKRVFDKHHLRNLDELFVAVAVGRLPLDRLMAEFVSEDLLYPERKALPTLLNVIKERVAPQSRKSSSPVLIKGEGDILVGFARCCNPIHGDPIMGFITMGHGITIHMTDCAKATAMDPSRRIEVAWDPESKALRAARIRVFCVNRPGLLANMTKMMSQEGVNINVAECRAIEDEKAVNHFEVMVLDRAQLQKVMSALERIRGVISVERVRS